MCFVGGSDDLQDRFIDDPFRPHKRKVASAIMIMQNTRAGQDSSMHRDFFSTLPLEFPFSSNAVSELFCVIDAVVRGNVGSCAMLTPAVYH